MSKKHIAELGGRLTKFNATMGTRLRNLEHTEDTKYWRLSSHAWPDIGLKVHTNPLSYIELELDELGPGRIKRKALQWGDSASPHESCHRDSNGDSSEKKGEQEAKGENGMVDGDKGEGCFHSLAFRLIAKTGR